MSRRNLIVLTAALAVCLLCIVRVEKNPFARRASHGFGVIDELALEDPPDEELFAGAMRGMVAVLRSHGDEHSAFLEPREASPLQAEMSQEFGGVGVRIQLTGDPPRLTVVEPPEPGTPAYASEIRAGDEIIAVDGKPVVGLGMYDVLGLMRGAPGEPIVLAILHQGDEETVDVRLVREVIQVPSIVGDRRDAEGQWRYVIEEEPRIALVRIVTFGNRTVDELGSTIRELVSDGTEGVVLDVRNNAGGALDAALGVAGMFLPADTLVLSTRGRGGEVLDVYNTPHDGDFLELPLAVLIDRNTASASEIVAAALQDEGRALVVGERSFGKGTVQQLLPILSSDRGESLMKLTTASYWRPSGVNIHRRPDTPEDEPWGVSPDEGFAIAQNEDDFIAWLEWRRDRDLLAEASEEDAADSSPLEQDPALTLAVEELGKKLID